MKGAAMHMAAKPTNVNGNSRHISGRGLHRRKLSLAERVRLGADLVSGSIQLEPSLQQTAELVRVPQAKIRDELKARAAAHETEGASVTALVEAWAGASEAEREAAVQLIGVADVWDVISRVVD
jgi:hypothetical protein